MWLHAHISCGELIILVVYDTFSVTRLYSVDDRMTSE
jgi:hypothetical protein